MESQYSQLKLRHLIVGFFLLTIIVSGVKAWTGEIHGRVVCDVCGDSSIGPEDHVLEVEGGIWLDDGDRKYLGLQGTPYPSYSEVFIICSSCHCQHQGAEVAVLCITKSGEVLNYQAFTNSKGIYTVAETMPESDRWDACLARPISSFYEHCTQVAESSTGVKFTYNHPSGYSHSVKPFVYLPASVPAYCI